MSVCFGVIHSLTIEISSLENISPESSGLKGSIFFPRYPWVSILSGCIDLSLMLIDPDIFDESISWICDLKCWDIDLPFSCYSLTT